MRVMVLVHSMKAILRPSRRSNATGILKWNRRRTATKLLLVRGVLLIQIADGFQPLVETFHFGLILRPQDAVPGKLRLFAIARGRERFTPILPVWDPVDHGIA